MQTMVCKVTHRLTTELLRYQYTRCIGLFMCHQYNRHTTTLMSTRRCSASSHCSILQKTTTTKKTVCHSGSCDVEGEVVKTGSKEGFSTKSHLSKLWEHLPPFTLSFYTISLKHWFKKKKNHKKNHKKNFVTFVNDST